MRSFIVTNAQAGRLPAWALIGLCALYILPGLIGRGPWDRADAEGFGLALTLLRGHGIDWLMPNVFGAPLPIEGPLSSWLGAAFGFFALPILGEALGIRLSVAVTLAATFALTWKSTHIFASRPAMQPADPFGASASRHDYARAVADAALLISMACCGLIARAHETTAEVVQMLWIAGFIWGASIALRRPIRGGLVIGATLAASLLTRGLPAALMLTLALLLITSLVPRCRLVVRPILATALLSALALSLPWPMALANHSAEGQRYLQAWLDWNLGEFGLASPGSIVWLLRTLPWYVWPAWPIAIWAVWRWRSRWDEPAVAIPLVLAASVLLAALLAPRATESNLLPLVLPLSLLAAYGLPTVSRAAASLLDWIAVTTFTLFGFVLWAYWLAYLSGVPPKMAGSVARLVPEYAASAHALQWLLGVAATLGWLWLVRWRVARQPRALWRPMVLSCCGLVLTWFLLMSLWLPAVESRKSFQSVASGVASALAADPSFNRSACVQAPDISLAQRTSLVWFGKLQFGTPGQICPWLLSRHMGRTPPAAIAGWELVWTGHRPHEPEQQIALWRRRG
jgi:4-amino-4-deoxy-L-arabinose transferase-like glycosyltransferase